MTAAWFPWTTAAASIPKSNLPSQASCGCSPSLLSTICISTWWPRKQEPAAQDEAEGETDKTGEPAGDDIEAQKTVDGNAVDTEPAEEAAGDGTSQSQSAGDESVAQNVSDSVVDVDAADSSDDSKSDADDEATEEDILNNTVADDDEDDEMDDEEDNVRPSDDVTPELETVIDLIEQLRQNRADEE